MNMLTREEFQVHYEQGPDAVFALFEQQTAQIMALSTRVQELEARLNKDSHNSSKPPSSDGLSKKPVSLRKQSGKPSGGQRGHPGRTLQQVATPDTVLIHSPSACQICGHSLESVPSSGEERRQVFDLPPLRLHVSEHRSRAKVCPLCQTSNRACFPPNVTQPVQYGERIQALVVYLMHYQLLPFARTQQLLSDLFDCSLSEGTLSSVLQECYQTLAPVETAIKQSLVQADVIQCDQTGIRSEGSLSWLHSSSTDRLTFYAPHCKRGHLATEAIGILPAFRGRSVHDAWAPYFRYTCSHALCNAHLLRELIGLYEQDHQPWMRRMIVLLLGIKRAVDRHKAAGAVELPSAKRAAYVACYQRLIEQGFELNPPAAPTGKRGRTKQTPARNLLDRMQTHQDAVLAFAHDFRVPFDNNLAERDLRMVKVRQKVSGCFRSAEGAKQFCRIRGYISTMRKQGYDLMKTLQSVFARQPVYPLPA